VADEGRYPFRLNEEDFHGSVAEDGRPLRPHRVRPILRYESLLPLQVTNDGLDPLP
jgi:hypothetical protein